MTALPATESNPCAFSALVHRIVVLEGLAPAKRVADLLGLTPDQLYARMKGRTRFSTEDTRRLIAAIPDPRLLRYFADDSAFVPVARALSRRSDSTDVFTAVSIAMRETADVVRIAADCIATETVDERNRQAMLREVRDAESAMATLRIALENAAPQPPRSRRSSSSI